MNKNIALLTLSLLLGASMVTSCGNDEDETLKPTEETEASKQLPEGTFVGWSEGSNPFAQYIPSGNDSIVITKAAQGQYDIAYLSATHGRGVIQGVSLEKNDTAFFFQKPISASKNEEGTAFVFSQVPDTIAMPNRNPQGGGSGAWANYPAIFGGGYLTTDGKRWELIFKVYCNIRYVHQVIVREGAIGNRRSQIEQPAEQ